MIILTSPIALAGVGSEKKMINPKEHLVELYTQLKNGSSQGISLYKTFESIKNKGDFLDEIYDLAINEGFAEQGKLQSFGSDRTLQLSPEGKRFDSYADFKNRHKPQTQININAPVLGSQIGQDSDFGNLEFNHNSINLEPNKQQVHPSDDAATTSQKESIFKKIYKWTDHKLISMLIYGLFFIIAIFIAKKMDILRFFQP
jgi:hypothetical protein